ncbi:hypothetical protein HX062_14000, partial [Myroides sp. DF42-4-2]|nr:hypothetical protein [Myroides sp. DF42-4-2]
MKKRLIPVALLMGAMSANAQVGIGTATPNKSAELTVEASNRGLLIPNVSLKDTKDTKTITNGNINSLLVFNTTTNTAITPGYYYWFVDKWQRLTTESDIPAIVVNNFENILQMEGDKVENLIKNIINTTAGNVIYEGDKLYYIDDSGNKVEINFEEIVKQNETVTILGYDPATGVMTYANEAGNAVTIDIKNAVKTFETVTSIAIDHTAGTITFMDEAGNPTVLALKDLVAAQETVTTLVRVQPGKYTYTNEAGTAVDITVIGDIIEVINNQTDTDLYNVLKQLVKVEQSLTSLVYNTTNRQLVYTDENNAAHNVDVDALVKENQYVTELQAGKNIQVSKTTTNNTITYTLDVPTATRDVAGVVKAGSGLDIDADGNLTVNLETAVNAKDLTGNEKIVVTDGKGAVLKTTSLDINESKLSLQNIGGALNVSQIQAGNAGDVLIVDTNGNVVWSANDAITTNVLALNGTDLVSTVNGVSSTVSLVDKLATEMFQNGSVTAEKLGAEAADQGKVPVVQADGTVVYQNIAAANVEGKELSSANELLAVSVGAGVVLKDVQLTINQDKFDLAQIGGTLQITQIQKGANETILVTDAAGNVSWVSKDTVVKANETVTVLVKNANGSYTYYNENEINADGTPKQGATGVTIDPKEVSVSLNTTTNKYEFTNSVGAKVGEIDANAGSIAFDNSTNGFTSTNVQNALEELKAQLDGSTDSLVDLGNGKFQHTTVDGDVVEFDINTVNVEKVVDANGNTSYIFKDAAGNAITTIA